MDCKMNCKNRQVSEIRKRKSKICKKCRTAVHCTECLTNALKNLQVKHDKLVRRNYIKNLDIVSKEIEESKKLKKPPKLVESTKSETRAVKHTVSRDQSVSTKNRNNFLRNKQPKSVKTGIFSTKYHESEENNIESFENDNNLQEEPLRESGTESESVSESVSVSASESSEKIESNSENSVIENHSHFP